jgi:hypothetical protein
MQPPMNADKHFCVIRVHRRLSAAQMFFLRRQRAAALIPCAG